MVEKKTVKIATAGAAALALIIGLSVGLTQNNSPNTNALSASSAEGVSEFNFEQDCTHEVIHGKSGKSNMSMGSGKSNKGGGRRLGQTSEIVDMAGSLKSNKGSGGSGKSGSGKSGSGKSGKSGSGKSGKSSELAEMCWNECEINWYTSGKSGKSDMSIGSGKSNPKGSGKSGSGKSGKSGSGKSGKSAYDVCEPAPSGDEPPTSAPASGEPSTSAPASAETFSTPVPTFPSSTGSTPTVGTEAESGTTDQGDRVDN